LLDPVEGVPDEEPPAPFTPRPVEVHPFSPRRAVPVREVGPELGQVVALWTEVVVDDVQHYGQPAAVTGRHETGQPSRPSVRILDGERIHPVVAPVPGA